MSEPRVRLRLAGEPSAAALPIAEHPPALPRAIAIAPAHAGADVEPMVRALRDALGAQVIRAVLRARRGSEIVLGDEAAFIRASADEMDGALGGLALDGAILVGAAFVALRRPRVAILVTGGASPVQWEPSVRAIRERFDLILEDARPGVARELAGRLR